MQSGYLHLRWAVACLLWLHSIHVTSVLTNYELRTNQIYGKSPCRTCPPGFGVLRMCNETHNTKCGECIQGTYQGAFTLEQICSSCTDCPEGYFEKYPCTMLQNAQCLPCADGATQRGDMGGGGGHGNENYLQKCTKRTTRFPMFPNSPTTTIITTTTTTTTTTATPVPSTTPYPTPGREVPGNGKVTMEESDKYTLRAAAVAPTTLQVNISVLEVGSPQVTSGSLQWPVAVAAGVAAVVFFIVGILVSCCLVRAHRRNQKHHESDTKKTLSKQTPEKVAKNGPPHAVDNGYDEVDSKTPILAGKAESWTHSAFLRDLPFNRNAPYIDMDPEDQTAHNIGRPPSLHYEGMPAILAHAVDRIRERFTRSGSVNSEPQEDMTSSAKQQQALVARNSRQTTV